MAEDKPGENALILCHAENQGKVELNYFEDGNRFYLDEMTEMGTQSIKQPSKTVPRFETEAL